MLLGVIRLEHSVECFGYYHRFRESSSYQPRGCSRRTTLNLWVLLMTGRSESTCNCTCNSIGIDTKKKSVNRATLLVVQIWCQIRQFWCDSIMYLAFSPGVEGGGSKADLAVSM